jgi:hypothetical protein
MENMVQNDGAEWMKELLEFRNWLYDIRQQTNQYVPKYLAGKVKFGPFLFRTRQAILDRLLDLQNRLQLELITPDELTYVHELLRQEPEEVIRQGLKKYILQLSNGNNIAVISDSNILLGPRTRLGALSLKQAKLIKTRKLASRYSQSTRVMYYQESR